MADTPTPEMASDEFLAMLHRQIVPGRESRLDFNQYDMDMTLRRLDHEIAERKRAEDELAAERARISMIRSRLTQATDGTQCGTLHDVGSWHDWAERLLAEIADTGPAKEGT
jgi:hypothetical protein